MINENDYIEIPVNGSEKTIKVLRQFKGSEIQNDIPFEKIEEKEDEVMSILTRYLLK